MFIYLAFEYEQWESSSLIGAYSDREKAKAACEKEAKRTKYVERGKSLEWANNITDSNASTDPYHGYNVRRVKVR